VKPLEWKRERIRVMRWVEVWRTEQEANGYGYSYLKQIAFEEEGATIRIIHRLKNTGEKRIVTDFYNHNFFNVDGDPVGPNYSFVFPFEPKAKDLKGKFGELVELKDKEFRFKDKVPSGDFVMAGIAGFDPLMLGTRRFEMRHIPSGIRVKADHSYPFAKFNVWGIKTTICPEPYMAIDLKPGDEMHWTITYTFTHEPPPKK